jgi:CheY-like chemotaxis protein
MKRDHFGVAGELRDTDGEIRSLRLQLNKTNYQHAEVAGTGAVGTTFKTTGTEARVELEHAPLGPLRGLVGVQAEDFDFSALGAEAFVPSTRTRRQALFLTEETAWPLGTLSAGLRVERAQVGSEGDADPAEPKFGAAAQRRFSLRSASLANVYKLSPVWSVSGTLSASERAPTSFELFANGLHAATAAIERGDRALQTERGTNLDLALEWKHGADHLRMGLFTARFSRFIALESTGVSIALTDKDGNVSTFPEYAFKSVPARLHGVEIDGRERLLEGPLTLDLSGKLDLTRATNGGTGEALPRVAPMRLALGLDAGFGPWTARVELEHASRQNRVPANDTATASYSIVNLSLTRSFDLADSSALWFLKLGNLGNTLAYNASTINTVRGLAPLPGRALKTGLLMRANVSPCALGLAGSADTLASAHPVRASLQRPAFFMNQLRPMAPGQAISTAADAPDSAVQSTPQQHLSVLYIEDNPVNTIVVQELVAMRPNVRLSCANDGLSGVARALDECPDVLLIDMQLPDIDGFEVLRRLRDAPALAGCVKIALSANGMSDDITRARAAGFDDYWTKPIDFKRFLAGLDALAAGRAERKARAG